MADTQAGRVIYSQSVSSNNPRMGYLFLGRLVVMCMGVLSGDFPHGEVDHSSVI